MKLSSCLLGLIGLSWIVYGLFQNVIDWNFGWQSTPKSVFEQKYEGVEDPLHLQAITKSKSIIDSIQVTSDAPSLSIATMIHGKMVWSYAVGYQDIAKKIPVTTNTRYRIGSVSKALTSLGLARAIEMELLHPDSSIQYYTEAFTDKPPVTIRQLASHQSGIRNYGLCLCFPVWEYYRDEEFKSVAESVEEFESDGLLFDPGTGFSYSSFNYTALSLAMEKATQKDFLEYMNEQIFAPLNMKHTSADKKGQSIKDRATPYDTDKGLFKEAFPVNLSNKWAGGGFLSSPSDLVRAGQVLLDSTFLDRETIQLITTAQRLSNDSINEQRYAFGWRHHSSDRYFEGQKQVEVIHHGGMAVGGQALLLVFPEYEMVIAMAMNKSGQQGQFELFDYIQPIANAFLKTLEEKKS